MGLSASSHHISASMQMMDFGVSQGVNPMLSNRWLGSEYIAPAVQETEMKGMGENIYFSKGFEGLRSFG